MNKTRLEAFSDGVIAIIITIMVLEMKVPEAAPNISDLIPILPVLLSYVLSFIYIGIYWSNHHHMLHACNKVTGGILWANLHLLFWLSLIPFVTGWMGKNNFASGPTALYGAIMLCAAIAYYILQTCILKNLGANSLLAKALGKDFKGKISPLLYAIAIPTAFYSQYLANALYIIVALIWLVPDRRIEKLIN